MNGLCKILSIDGGGIRGIIPARILSEIEHIAGHPVSSLFDLIAGTSTGGILALALTKPGPDGTPAFTPSQLVTMYEEHGAAIFPKSLFGRLAKYPSAGIEGVLDRYFGDARLKDALTDVLLPSYEIERRQPFFFRSRFARQMPEYDFPMKVAARATSAAPTYFNPLKIEVGGNAGYYALIDGGLYANNPALCALAEAHATYPKATDLLVVSLGTGSLTRPLPYDNAVRWNLAKWVKPVLDIAFDGVSSTVDYQLRQLLPREESGVRRYYRFQVTLDACHTEMDNPHPRNLHELKLLAEALIHDRAEDLQDLCRRLTPP